MVSVKDIHWAAGFMEGEGSFMFVRNGKNSGGITVVASQVQREPLERLQRMFGGKVKDYPAYGKGQPFSRWQSFGSRAAGVAMTLFPLLSPRRQEQVKIALAQWRPRTRGSAMKARTHCAKGHEWSEVNTKWRDGHRVCRSCSKASNRKSYLRKKGGIASG